ncbi:transcriptional regulator, GntR family [Desulfonatronospira thiodismutans ASO3-1]|uniref:Transcriptional regulator, GntR family n=1 Tax=Desulfonatronospira thiodismutans ASO3-1 TaxID=555779 RepID=D6SP35_9BACT|nr:GntR family transcriptional regulator [Desulfonatronospira thiodismutans]EFI34511.1 transcriptional regulator, GntR family [Desulfonatronospira thiodismutans ASO3-1]
MEDNNCEMKSLVAYQRIRDMIISREKFPGTRLVISDLEDELGIGKGPIREALMRLDRSGLVRNIPYKGAVVAEAPRMREIEAIYEMRAKLETTLALEAMENVDEQDIANLESILSEMDPELNLHELYHLDRYFHSQLYGYSRLPHLCLVVDKLMESVDIFLINRPRGSKYLIQMQAQHNQIIDALKNKDETMLKKSLKHNIKHGLRLIKKAYGPYMHH